MKVSKTIRFLRTLTLFHAMALFRQVAMEVGKGLGYAYPLDLDERVTAFVKDMHNRR